MGADILERLDFMLISRRSDEDAIIRDARAEIVRLRGEVESLTYRLDTANAYGEQCDADIRSLLPSIAPAEAKDPAPAMPNGVEARRHAANEWADMATNGVQWLRNIRAGISTADEALAEMESNLLRVRALNDEAQHMQPRAADHRDAAGVDTLVAKDVQRVMADGDGFWAPCSGCYETEDGHPVGEYPYSSIFQCILGGGCRECGGLGAVWDNTDYDAMAEATIGAEDTPAAVPAGEAECSCDELTQEADGSISGLCSVCLAYLRPKPVQAAPQKGGDSHAFKNFHRSLCARFGYTHDENDWRRDLASLEEHIARMAAHPSACELVVDEAMFARLALAYMERHDVLEVCWGDMAGLSQEDGTAALQHRGDSQEVGRG